MEKFQKKRQKKQLKKQIPEKGPGESRKTFAHDIVAQRRT